MSIYATAVHFCAEDHADDCAMWVEVTDLEGPGSRWGAIIDGLRYWLNPDTACTCRCGPIRYDGSHILPSNADPRAGSFAVCHIPGFIDRGDRPAINAGDEDFPAHPWLRVWVAGTRPDDPTVILDRSQVAELSAYLSEWLANTKEEPPA